MAAVIKRFDLFVLIELETETQPETEFRGDDGRLLM